VANAKPPKGKLSILIPDGGNLLLQCTVGWEGHVRRSWTFKYQLLHHRREMGLGPYPDVSLAEARQKAHDLRALLRDDVDPLEQRQARRRALIAERAKATTFQQCAEAYIALHERGWSRKHRNAFSATLRTFVFPVLGGLAPADITSAMVLKIVQSIWLTKTVTAGRVLNRIERVLDYATTAGFRSGDNPARHVLEALPKAGTITTKEHLAAMPYADVPAFLTELRKLDTIPARALEFLVLTATRSGETLGAMWSEIDLANKVWTIPASRMKGGEEHRVPLSDRALAILADMPPNRERVFPRNTNSLTYLLAKFNADVTVHGFRSSFRQWTHEKTNYPDHVAEVALAHKIGGDVERTYKRKAELFDRRRKLMELWASFCSSKPAAPAGEVVVPLRKVGADA
jgi:integrase